MSTTIVETWVGTDIATLGPIYPMVGTEVLLWIIGLGFWLGFHVLQARVEAKEFEEDERAARTPERLRRVFEDEAME